MTDKELIDSIKNDNSNSALIELVSRHEGLYYKMSQRYRYISNYDFDGEKYLFFYKTVKDFDESRGMKFSSFLAERTRFMCKTLCGKIDRSVELDEKIPMVSRDEFSEEMQKIRARINEIADSRAKNVLLYRYFHSSGKILPFAKIAKKVKTSPRNAKYIHDRYINLIRNFSKQCLAQ